MQKIEPHWDDMLRLARSLKLGRVPVAGMIAGSLMPQLMRHQCASAV